jgi:hypothetical protein
MDPEVLPDRNTTTDAFEYFASALDHPERNPMDESAAGLAALVEGAGLEAAADDDELRRAVNDMVDDATRMLDASLTTWPRRNGWTIPTVTSAFPIPTSGAVLRTSSSRSVPTPSPRPSTRSLTPTSR